MKILNKTLILLISLLILPNFFFAWQGKVVGVSYGDTMTVLHNDKGEKVRLYGIDTPEKHQDFGKKQRNSLLKWFLVS